MGYSYIHSAIDAHSRLAYSEIHEDEQAVTAIGFSRAKVFYAAHGVTIERVMDRQRQLLSLEGLRGPARVRGDPPHLHAALSPGDEREDRALQPDAGRGVGLRPKLWLKGRPTTST
jgi:hypothetical protein